MNEMDQVAGRTPAYVHMVWDLDALRMFLRTLVIVRSGRRMEFELHPYNPSRFELAAFGDGNYGVGISQRWAVESGLIHDLSGPIDSGEFGSLLSFDLPAEAISVLFGPEEDHSAVRQVWVEEANKSGNCSTPPVVDVHWTEDLRASVIGLGSLDVADGPNG